MLITITTLTGRKPIILRICSTASAFAFFYFFLYPLPCFPKVNSYFKFQLRLRLFKLLIDWSWFFLFHTQLGSSILTGCLGGSTSIFDSSNGSNILLLHHFLPFFLEEPSPSVVRSATLALTTNCLLWRGPPILETRNST